MVKLKRVSVSTSRPNTPSQLCSHEFGRRQARAPRHVCLWCFRDTGAKFVDLTRQWAFFFLRQRQKRAPRLNARKLAKPAPAPNPKVHVQFPPVPPTHESVRLALKRGTKPLNLQLRQRKRCDKKNASCSILFLCAHKKNPVSHTLSCFLRACSIACTARREPRWRKPAANTP